jgi:long-chain-fatty-acid--CoA ligase ACSBG
MEEKMRAVGAANKGIKKKLATWAKGLGLEAYRNEEVGGSGLYPPLYWLAKKLVLSKVRVALGFDECTSFFTGAAPTSKETFMFFGALGISISELYGMSECTGPQTISRPNYRRLGSCGASIPSTELKIDHVDGRDKPGEGEICYRGRHIMMGYMKDAHKTQEAIDSEGFLHSGDVGRVDQNGLLYITGRIKELLITAGGENIAPVPIEESVKKELPAIANCMLVGDRRKFNSLLVTLKTEPDLDSGAFTDKLIGDAANVSPAKSVQQAMKDPAWRKYVQAGVDRANKQATSRACYIQKFVILPTDFSVPGGELTPTLKVKRAVVCEKYKDVIEAMYSDGSD